MAHNATWYHWITLPLDPFHFEKWKKIRQNWIKFSLLSVSKFTSEPKFRFSVWRDCQNWKLLIWLALNLTLANTWLAIPTSKYESKNVITRLEKSSNCPIVSVWPFILSKWHYIIEAFFLWFPLLPHTSIFFPFFLNWYQSLNK